MDEIDRAEMETSAYLTARINAARANTAPREGGRCMNCADRLDDGRAYCNDDCKKDHEARERTLARQWRYR